MLMPIRDAIAPPPAAHLLTALGGAIREHIGPELIIKTRIGAKSRKAAYEQATNHPMVQALLRRFDGEIIGQELINE
jgi:hypothetical protein